jgi:glutathionylspermidine synthase
MANKAMLPLLYSMYPDNKLLLPAFFDYSTANSKIGSYKKIVSKPIFGREGTGVKFGFDYSSSSKF